MHSWLVENGYMRTDPQVKRDELVKLMNEKYVLIHRSLCGPSPNYN